jgi:glycosyltransferase involved in cell wall biosynthesis
MGKEDIKMAAELAVVLPVYNEAGIIEKIIEEWSAELNRQNIDFEIQAYNDGSSDRTLELLAGLALKNAKLVVHNETNAGHGPTILKGYRENSGQSWIFQTDSDGEIGPEGFRELWEQRNNYDLLVGKRQRHHQPLVRAIISSVSRLLIWVLYGRGVSDVNVPYRLMRAEKFRPLFFQIPSDTFAPNLIISGMAPIMKARILEAPVQQYPRRTGKASLNKMKLLGAALKAFSQTIGFRFGLYGRA